MLKNLKRKKGFASLLEIVITSIIFIIAAFGIFTSIASFSPKGKNSSKRLEAAYIGRRVLDELRSHVDARVWDKKESGLLTGESYATTLGNYTVKWQLADVPDLKLRRLLMNIYENNP